MPELTAEVVALGNIEVGSKQVKASWLPRPGLVMVEVATLSANGLYTIFTLLGYIDPDSSRPGLVRTTSGSAWPTPGSSDEERLIVEALHAFTHRIGAVEYQPVSTRPAACAG